MPRCKSCKEKFEQYEFNNKYCKSIDCQTDKALFKLGKIKKQEVKDWKKEKKVLKEKLKTWSDYFKETQKVFNTFIRERDKLENCISSNRPLIGKFDAGHYFPAGSYKNLALDEDNCHGQSVHDNRDKHGNLAEYKIGLIKRIGKERFESLEKRRLIERHYSIPELILKKQEYKEKVGQLKR